MKAVVFHDVGDIRLEDVPDPSLKEPTDAIASAKLLGAGRIKPTEILTNREPLTGVIEAYKAFDKRQPGWIKVALH